MEIIFTDTEPTVSGWVGWTGAWNKQDQKPDDKTWIRDHVDGLMEVGMKLYSMLTPI